MDLIGLPLVCQPPTKLSKIGVNTLSAAIKIKTVFLSINVISSSDQVLHTHTRVNKKK